MNTSRVAATVRCVLLCVCLLVAVVGCPPPGNQEPFEVLLINGTPNILNVYFNTSMQNPSAGASNRIDVAAGSVATARFGADDLGMLAPGSDLQLLVSVAGGGTPLALNNPQQTISDHPAGGQAAVLVTASGNIGQARLIDVAP